jgi:peptidoglycan/xylan/chitin deacetylase (PgdA/CDA1 family)
VTFDDGYRDNLEQALPVLQSLRIPATLFVSSAYLDGDTFFADGINEAIRRAPLTGLDASSLGLPYLDLGGLRARMNAATVVQQILKYRKPAERDAITAQLVAMLAERPLPRLMMTADQLRTMQKAGVSIAAHGHRHPMLSMLTDAEIEADLLENMRILQDITGVRPTEFAYPNGRCGSDFSGRHADLLRHIGVEVAVTTSSGIVRQGNDPLMLPRFSPWDRSTLSFRLRLLREIRKSSDSLLPAAT